MDLDTEKNVNESIKEKFNLRFVKGTININFKI